MTHGYTFVSRARGWVSVAQSMQVLMAPQPFPLVPTLQLDKCGGGWGEGLDLPSPLLVVGACWAPGTGGLNSAATPAPLRRYLEDYLQLEEGTDYKAALESYVSCRLVVRMR